MTVYRVTASTVTPLHIGAGEELRLGFDFMVRGKHTYRLNVDAVLEAHPEGLQPQRDGRYILPGLLLKETDYNNPALFRYALPGHPRSHKGDARMQACIKDVYDRPYIPGSSLKGVLRTALAWTGWNEVRPELHSGVIGRRKEWAASRLEKQLFGPDPNTDLLRALQVADFHLEESNKRGMMVANANVLTKGASASPIELETIAPNTEFNGSIHVDDTLFQPEYERKLKFNNRKHWLEELFPRAQAHSRARIEQLQAWFAEAQGGERIARFYGNLLNLELSETQALVQLGWGGGWDSKTYWTHLTGQPELFASLLRDFRMDRAGRQGRTDPAKFPKSKRVVMSRKKESTDEVPAAPFGWVLLEMEPTD